MNELNIIYDSDVFRCYEHCCLSLGDMRFLPGDLADICTAYLLTKYLSKPADRQRQRMATDFDRIQVDFVLEVGCLKWAGPSYDSQCGSSERIRNEEISR